MKSLHSMTAEFARKKGSKDKAPRKKKTLLGSIGKGALIGAAIPVAALGGYSALAAGVGSVARRYSPLRVAGNALGYGLLGGGIVGGSLAPKGAALGAGIGAAGYGINKLRNKEQPEKRSRITQILGRK